MVKAASASVEDKAGGPTRTAQAQRKPAERGENDTRERCDVCEGLGEVARCEMRDAAAALGAATTPISNSKRTRTVISQVQACIGSRP